ncbi:MAG: glycosyltransferase family 39 protein, partial [Micrococcales bacterium]
MNDLEGLPAVNFSGLKDRSIRLKNTVVKHKELSIVVSLLFAARLFLSNLQSYWLDEHYSVWAYGSYFSNPFEMGFFFAKESVHPPLYQMTLWFYMKIFGDSEIATRTLSNIFIAIAMIALYALIRDAVPKWLAVLAAAVYGAEPSGILYAIETRSY